MSHFNLPPYVPVDSTSVGDSARFLNETALEHMLGKLEPSPVNVGSVVLMIRRADNGLRERVDRVYLDPTTGFPGDAWGRKVDPKLHSQITVMQCDVALLIANGQPIELFGDNLFLNLDLSAANLPTGTRVRLGHAVLEVTYKPHNGCHKFQARFGHEAMRFAHRSDIRPLNLRGIHMLVLEGGWVQVGDTATVVQRGDSAP